VTSILLLRHGESEWNAAGRWQGWADTALTATGRLQAAEAAERLRGHGFGVILASDLQRTLDTAGIIAGILRRGPVLPEPGIREFDVGEWSGLTRPEIEARWPGALAAWSAGELTRTPGGEERSAFVARVKSALVGIGERYPNQAVLAVSHGGVIGALQHDLTDGERGERIGNLMGRWIEVTGDRLALGPLERPLSPDETTLSPSR
jgi:broad specificity phosphatase PhoE